jgi:hypothetical protein
LVETTVLVMAFLLLLALWLKNLPCCAVHFTLKALFH